MDKNGGQSGNGTDLVAALSAADANREFYARHAETYDRTEECVVEPRLRRRLHRVLERSLAVLPQKPRVLDACGGSGNVSLMLHELGVEPFTVDISPEMLAIYHRNAHARGFAPKTEVSEIDAFLGEDPRAWDLIVFSSALHHLENYEETIELALRRLAPGGVLATIFDPTRVSRRGRALRRLDYIFHVVVKTPRRVPELVRRRLRRQRTRDGGLIGQRAEKHALSGIDDVALRGQLVARGLRILSHERPYEARFAVTRLLVRLLREPTSFDLVVRRPTDG